MARDEAHLRKRKQREAKRAEQKRVHEAALVRKRRELETGMRRLHAPVAVHQALAKQITRFRERFGRDPQPGEPVFYGPAEGEAPEPMKLEHVDALRETSEAIGLPLDALERLVAAGLTVQPTQAG